MTRPAVLEKRTLVPLPAGREGQGGGQMRFPQAGVAHAQERLRLADVLPTRQLEDLGLRALGEAGAINVGPFFQGGEPCGPDQLGLPILLPLRDFLCGERPQEAVVAQIGLGGLLGHLPVVTHARRQPQLREVCF